MGPLAGVWIWLALGFAVLLLGAAGYFGVRALWARALRRSVVSLIGQREAILASRRTLEAVVRHLADEDDEALEHFATHPESEDRKALAEVTMRMEILAGELDTRPVPRTLVPVAEGLADAAFVISREAGRIGESAIADEVYEELAQIDLASVADVYRGADARVKEAAERYHLDEASVYGGGLYI